MDLDINQYINIFVEESKEHLQNMNDVLLELEKSPSNHDYINEIFRVAHTLKGMSGTMGFNNMGNLTHYMENVLQAIRNNEIEVSDEIIDLLFECFDALDTSVNHIMDYGLEDSKSYDELINRLNKLLSKERSNIVNSDDKSKINPSQKNIMELEHHLVKVLKKAKSEGLNVFKIDISLRETCMLKAARAFIVFSTLETFGEIIHSHPPVDDIEDEKFDLNFSIMLVTAANESDLLESLSQISELDKIVLTLLDDSIDIIETNNVVAESDEDSSILHEKSTKNEKVTQSNLGKIGKTVRVDIDRLDNLMNLVSELIIIKTRMDDLSGKAAGENMTEAIEYLERITTSLHDAVMKVRMVPIERVFNRFPRLVRDLSKELGKEIDLQMSGEETEVDRTVIDEIGDPLIHLIRNSIDHGIELPKDRLKIGKPERGKLILKSYPDGNNVVIEVEDDGKGIDYKKIVNKALERGLITDNEVESLSIEESINLLFLPGFSTADKVSDLSGRGVGLDVVKSKIESINGSVEVESVKDKGTKFVIRIPLTLAIIQALLIKLSQEIYALPLSSVSEIINISSSDIRDVQGQEIALYRGKTIPILRLKNLLEIPEEDGDEDLVVVVVNKGDKQAGLIVDSLIGQQEIVIKSLGKYLSGIKYLSGATILGNGNISLILDVNSLI